CLPIRAAPIISKAFLITHIQIRLVNVQQPATKLDEQQIWVIFSRRSYIAFSEMARRKALVRKQSRGSLTVKIQSLYRAISRWRVRSFFSETGAINSWRQEC